MVIMVSPNVSFFHLSVFGVAILLEWGVLRQRKNG